MRNVEKRNFVKDVKIDSPSLIMKIAHYFGTNKVYKVDINNFYGYVLERLGIDYILMLEENKNKIITLQLKLRDSKYYMQDICIELYHVYPDRKERGNIFDIKADYIVYAWYRPEEGQQEVKTILSPALLINVVKLKRFFDKNKSIYEIIPTRGTQGLYEQWITYNMFIPIEDCNECYEIIELSS